MRRLTTQPYGTIMNLSIMFCDRTGQTNLKPVNELFPGRQGIIFDWTDSGMDLTLVGLPGLFIKKAVFQNTITKQYITVDYDYTNGTVDYSSSNIGRQGDPRGYEGYPAQDGFYIGIGSEPGVDDDCYTLLTQGNNGPIDGWKATVELGVITYDMVY